MYTEVVGKTSLQEDRMTICSKCNSTVDDGFKFCTNCGAVVDDNASGTVSEVSDQKPEKPVQNDAQNQYKPSYQPVQSQPAQQNGDACDQAQSGAYQHNPYVPPIPISAVEPVIPEKYRLMSAWGYIGYSLLFSIPIVGFICAIVFAVSDDYINRRNYARSVLIGIAISAVLAIVLIIVFLSIVGQAVSTIWNM